MWEKIKEHPWVVGGIVGVLLLVLVFSSSSPSSSPSTGSASASSGNGDQLTAYLASLNQQGQIASIQSQNHAQDTAAAVTVAGLEAATRDTANTLAAQVAEFETSVAGNVQTNHDTLAAQVQESTIAAGVTNTQTVAGALVQEQQINAETNKAYINTIATIYQGQQQVQAQQIQANKDIQTQSWFSKIFG